MELVDEQATTIVVVENTSLVVHQEKVFVDLEPLCPNMLDLGEEQLVMNNPEDMVFEESEQGIMVTGKGCSHKETFMEHEKVESSQVEVPIVRTITPKKTCIKHWIFQQIMKRRPIGSLNSPRMGVPLLA
jgi:hypothetical protein